MKKNHEECGLKESNTNYMPFASLCQFPQHQHGIPMKILYIHHLDKVDVIMLHHQVPTIWE